ncbi:DNA-binding protein HU [Aquimixticola soesokkakensis]|uniref:DNA-binding protein HU n=1 Tax=Aquimixticola soesokkakensis TaxID=1519096 RepID=A0A1Y5SDR3_9RHOB|nr:HU family DNA-binding protein [Aquimixticola soesokkakensis]SLN38370.1 DNA-binding protein HU [Aquimixticola soesokkakensis]
MATYSKTQLIDDLAAELGFAKPSTKEMVDALFAKIAAKTEAGDKVNIAGFGRFDMRERSARMGRNPATGEAIQIAASRSIGFKASKGKA